MNVNAKERSDFRKEYKFFLRSLQQVNQDISNTLDLSKAIADLNVEDDECRLPYPLLILCA
jgi:hypothetical protein